MKPSQALLIHTKVQSYIRFQVCQNQTRSTPPLIAVSLFLLFQCSRNVPRVGCMRKSSRPSFTSRGATGKASDPKERPKDTAEASSQAEETAEIERGSRIRREGDADLQAPLRVAAVFVDPGAFHKVAHGAVPTEFFGPGTLGLGLIWFHDLVLHCPISDVSASTFFF